MAIDLQNISTEQLKRVIEIKEKIDALQNELNQVAGEEALSRPAVVPATAPKGEKRGGYKRSAAARARMAEAQRQSWAARRQGAGVVTTATAEAKPKGKGKRVMTDEWKAKLSAAQKARWAKQRGEAVPALAEKPARKKKTMTPKALAALAKARAVRSAKAKAARGE